MQIEAYIVTKERSVEPVDAREMSDDWYSDDTVRWTKTTSAAPEEVEQALGPLNLHPRIVTAWTAPAGQPDVVAFETALFARIPVWNADEEKRSCVRFVSVSTTLITIQDEPIEFIEQVVAVCGCLPIAYMFAFGCLVIEAFFPGSIVIGGQPADREHLSRFGGGGLDFMYFSFTTLTTLGYGDILPVSRLARSLAMLQVIGGQPYLAAFVARLVGVMKSGSEP